MEGYAFYALDLRKHGRSLRPHQHPNFCKNVAEYYPDITRAIDVIGEPVLLAGHSTGGLICALYAHEGPHREHVQRAVAEQPVLRLEPARLAAHAARTWRRRSDASSRSSTIRKRCCPTTPQALLDQGWEFELALKPVPGFPVYYGWLGAIADAHARVHAGLDAALPGAGDAFGRGRHRARLAAHRALVAHARARGHGARVSRRACTTSRCRAPRSARRSSGSSFPGRNEPVMSPA